MLALSLAIFAVTALVAGPAGRRIGRAVFVFPAIASAATLALLAAPIARAVSGTVTTESYAWVPGLGLSIDLRLDAFGALMTLLVVAIQLLVAIYAYGYFAKPKPGIGRFAATLTAFAGAMLGLVLSDDILLVFVFWELTSVSSYLLIGTDDRRRAARAAALQALLTTGAGGLAMLGGLVILGQAAGTYSLSAILAAPPEGTTVTVGLVLILLGAFTKSAQVPFHSWLPGAMAAPTPVSAYLHSATMVKAGIYLIARLSPAFASVPVWRPLVLTVGGVTMLLGGWRALRQHDLKLVLAYGTISQLGFLTLLFGAGYPETTLAGTAVLLAHAAFKASLFMTVGIVDHQTHTRDLRRLSGLGRTLRPTAVVAILAAASMAGLPPLFGFVAKEAAFEALLGDAMGVALITLVVVGSVLTVAYTARYVWGGFARKQPYELEEVVAPTTVPPAVALVAPAGLLAVLGLALGIWPAAGSPLVVGAAMALDPAVPDYPLALWHGFNLALGLSALAVGAGLVAWKFRYVVEGWQARMPAVPDGSRIYQATLSGVMGGAKRVTAVVQNGSLPIYLGVILVTTLVLPGAMLAGAGLQIGELRFTDHPMQAVAVAIIVVGAVATTAFHRRFPAVLALGAVGYGIAVLFVLQGAPDLAITQLLIETLILVLFVLVLRHLPERFDSHRWKLGQIPRIVIAVGMGVLAMAFTATAVAARVAPPVSAEFIERAVPDGGGRNVVNVILVDFRGFDTFGEIVVLTATALGVLALVRAARRDRPESLSTRTGLTEIPRRHRSVVLETGIRAVFRPLVLFSIYLLFAGHNDPGGGFIGGLVAGSALILVAVGHGIAELRRRLRVRAEWLLGSGILLASGSAAIGWLADGGFLTRASVEIDVPVFGALYLSTTASFDVGVYLVVVGLVVALLRSLGSEEVTA